MSFLVHNCSLSLYLPMFAPGGKHAGCSHNRKRAANDKRGQPELVQRTIDMVVQDESTKPCKQ
jgi:hypothetical protein